METPEVSGKRAPGAVDFTILYLAARILQTAGFDAERVARALREIYGVEVEPAEAKKWFNIVPSVVKVRTHPSLYRFLQRLSRDKLPALRYAVGAALGDGDSYGRLGVADWGFAYAYASAVATLFGAPTEVRKTRDGRYRISGCRLIGLIAKSSLWKVVAYLDRLDERKYFLSGLLDAEGSLIPIVDRKHKNLRVRVQFANANYELAAYVMEAFKELGLKPRILVIEPGEEHVKKDGETVRRRKTLYKVLVDLNPPQITPLAKVGFNCWRKRLLLEFFLAVASLPPRQRHEEFARWWKKIDDEWMPAILDTGQCRKPAQAVRRQVPEVREGGNLRAPQGIGRRDSASSDPHPPREQNLRARRGKGGREHYTRQVPQMRKTGIRLHYHRIREARAPPQVPDRRSAPPTRREEDVLQARVSTPHKHLDTTKPASTTTRALGRSGKRVSKLAASPTRGS